MFTDEKNLVLDLEVILPLLEDTWEFVSDFNCFACGELHVMDLPILDSFSIDLLRDVVLNTDFSNPLTSLDREFYLLSVSGSPP